MQAGRHRRKKVLLGRRAVYPARRPWPSSPRARAPRFRAAVALGSFECDLHAHRRAREIAMDTCTRPAPGVSMTPRRFTVDQAKGVLEVEWPLFGELSRALALK